MVKLYHTVVTFVKISNTAPWSLMTRFKMDSLQILGLISKKESISVQAAQKTAAGGGGSPLGGRVG